MNPKTADRCPRTARWPARVLPLLALALLFRPDVALGEVCGSLKNGYGPFDYRHAVGDQVSIVEKYHFDSDVEQLRHGMTSYIGGDLSYTLRAIPNHPRALWAMVRLSRKERKEQPQGSQYTVECWFERATRFAPDDGEVRLLYGLWLISNDHKRQASEQLDTARKLMETSDRLKRDPNIAYNLGLGFFDLGRYDDAVAMAKRAQEMGFPLSGLENKLRRANKWPQ